MLDYFKMETERAYITVIVVDDMSNKVLYQDKYDDVIMIGELIRNLCVNLFIDPDTIDGITKNVDVYKDKTLWKYSPTRSIKELNLNDNKLTLSILKR